MALEMKIYKEIAAYEPKPMFGRTWRQIAAIAFMLIIGGGVFAAVTFALITLGQTMEQATTVAMYVMFPILVPAALWGWWRPMGLKPEQYLGFFFRHVLVRKTVSYEDTYQGQNQTNTPARARHGRANSKQRQEAIKKLNKTVTEYATPEKSSGTVKTR